MEDKIEKIKKISGKDAVAKIVEPTEEVQRSPPNKEKFDNIMQAPPAKPETTVDTFDPSKKSSLLDEVRELNSGSQKATRVTPSELIAQTDQATNQIEDLKSRLSEPGASIKESAVPLLRNKISHINENIRVALSHAGTEFAEKPPLPVTTKENPISRFLGLLTDGQYRLRTLGQQVEALSGTSLKEINPAKLLLIQIKVNQVQQEIELFSGILNQTLQSVKTIMNVQV